MSFKGKSGGIVPDVYTWRKHLLSSAVAQDFNRLFRMGLITFLSVTRGFNIVEFAWRLGTDLLNAGRPWQDVVREKAGDEGVALVELLMGPPQYITPDEHLKVRPTLVTLPKKAGPQSTTFASAFADGPAPPQANGTGASFGAMFAEEAPEGEAQEEAPQPPTTGGFASLFEEQGHGGKV